MAKKYEVTRAEQDEFALQSQLKAEAAHKAGKFKDEILPLEITSKKGTVVFDSDEYIKPGSTLESLAGLRPAFAKDGTVTAGNASAPSNPYTIIVDTTAPAAPAIATDACLQQIGRAHV